MVQAFNVSYRKAFMKILLILLICLSLVYCSKNKKTLSNGPAAYVIIPGQTTEAQLKTILGQPEKQEQALLRSDAQNAKYKDATYEIVNSKVNAVFRSPRGDEEKIQFWLHKWDLKKQKFTSKELVHQNASYQKTATDVAQKEIIYTSNEDHLSVIYSSHVNKVIRVIEYAK